MKPAKYEKVPSETLIRIVQGNLYTAKSINIERSSDGINFNITIRNFE